jgi:hypothetical protein
MIHLPLLGFLQPLLVEWQLLIMRRFQEIQDHRVKKQTLPALGLAKVLIAKRTVLHEEQILLQAHLAKRVATLRGDSRDDIVQANSA